MPTQKKADSSSKSGVAVPGAPPKQGTVTSQAAQGTPQQPPATQIGADPRLQAMEEKQKANVQQSIQVPDKKMTIADYLDLTIQRGASDFHLSVNYPPFIRVDSELIKVGSKNLTQDEVKELIYAVLSERNRELYEVNKEVDFSYAYGDDARFRVNTYHERGHMAAAFRLIPSKIRTLEELFMPEICHEFVKLPHGLVLVTGPTGCGKSTTLAAMLNEINQTQPKHIVTIEDPIEYVYPQGNALIDQREIGQDTHSWEIALRSVLREDPDVVLVGEMRDKETIAAAVTVAETGHLVFATLHTNTASQTMDRIIDVFPEHQQAQIRTQLANVVEGVISQRLIPIIGGGRRAAVEVMVAVPAVRNAIRENKSYQIDNVIQTGFDVGMITLERSLSDLVREGKVTLEDAKNYTPRPEELARLMKKG